MHHGPGLSVIESAMVDCLNVAGEHNLLQRSEAAVCSMLLAKSVLIELPETIT